MKEVISILMPVKNTSAYLHDCLDSILKQTYIHWELLAVDDGSDDDSFQILQSYASKDTRIKALKNEGKGIIHALRTAYKNANGTLITRMDSDDLMTADKLKLMSTALKENGINHLTVGLVEYFSDDELGQGYSRYADWLNELTKNKNNFKEIYKECVIPSPCWMVWKDDLEKCGAFLSDIYPEDYDLCFRMYQHRLNIIPVQKTLHYWRDYPLRTSRNDPNYLDNRFVDLKIKYFFEIDYKKEQSFFLWGAGKKGKNIAKKIIEKNITFHWICDNERKIGKDIYDVRMEHFDTILHHKNAQVIISVSSPKDVVKLKKWLHENNIYRYWFFG
ncbi:MAG: glycosyltransferase involved in cell wall biosynthesis [Maribacter sp.]|jgi:glycosyltransferase involved in cell wall biosynthesis